MLSFSILGFPVRVHWMFWVVAGLLSGALSMQGPELFVTLSTWIPIVFVSILWHELGHAQAQKKYGGRPEILLYGMGGLASASVRVTRHQSMWISAAGPAASISLYLATLLVAIVMGMQVRYGWTGAFVVDAKEVDGVLRPTVTMRIFNSLLWVNGFWTLINLLPILPLDGGRIFEAFMATRNPRIVPTVGMVVAGVVAVAGFLFFGSLFMAILFGFMAYENWKRRNGTYSGSGIF